MWVLKQAATTRAGASATSDRSVELIDDSELLWPGSSALVESDSSSRIPSSANRPRAPKWVVCPPIGVGSSLKSPECNSRPSGVSNRTLAACGTECVTGMSWNRNGAWSTHRSGSTRRNSAVTPISSARG